MTPAWAQRREELLSDCIVSPDVFHQMGGRVSDLHFPTPHAMLMPPSEGERHGTHSCTLPPLSHRLGHEGQQDQSAHLQHDRHIVIRWCAL